MSNKNAQFAPTWLNLREPVDHASRAHALARAAAHDLERQSAQACVVDLGSGSGSNLRYLAPRLPAARWRLIDHDTGLLDAARHSCSDVRDLWERPLTIETRGADLDGALETGLDGAALVTASALLDLVSNDWLTRFVAACAARGAAVLCALNVDGQIAFRGRTDRDDAPVMAALTTHQQGDKGLGPALGAAAPRLLIDRLSAHGYVITSTPSVWHLDAQHAALATALIGGWAQAAHAVVASPSPWIRAWADRRAADIARGTATLTVGHIDVLGLAPGG